MAKESAKKTSKTKSYGQIEFWRPLGTEIQRARAEDGLGGHVVGHNFIHNFTRNFVWGKGPPAGEALVKKSAPVKKKNPEGS